MHKLLIAIDGSNNALDALRYAAKLAQDNGPLELHLITVLPEPVIYGEIEVYVSRQEMEKMQREHGAELLAPATAILKAAGLPHTTEVVIGDIAPTISRRANELRCDGIVMGTRGMGAMGNMVMGSVATKVVHLTALPVTLVK